MTEAKARKRAVRKRMAKTGERYSAARRHVVKPNDDFNADDLPQNDAAVRKNTGKGWREWFGILDRWGAKERRHGEITRYLNEEHGVPGWWTQTLTVGYERVRGMRAKYQTASGFQVSVSKTLPVSVKELSRAFEDAGRRRRWLEPGTLKERKVTAGKTGRYDFRDGTSRVLTSFESKGRGKATVHIQHEKLPEAGSVEELRSFWKERLGKLAEVLTS